MHRIILILGLFWSTAFAQSNDCTTPEWALGLFPQDGFVHGGACLESSDHQQDGVKGRLLAIKDMLARFQGIDVRVLSILRDLGNPVLGFEKANLMLGQMESRLASVASAKGVEVSCISNRCGVCCHARARREVVKDVMDEILQLLKLDDVLESSLRVLAEQTGIGARKLVVYQFRDYGLSGKIGDFLVEKVENVSVSKKIFEVVPRVKVFDFLKKKRLNLDTLVTAPMDIKQSFAELTNLVLTGSYSQNGEVLEFEMVALRAFSGEKVGVASGVVLLSSFPTNIVDLPKEEQDSRKLFARMEVEQRKSMNLEDDDINLNQRWIRWGRETLDRITKERWEEVEKEIRGKYKDKKDDEIRRMVRERLEEIALETIRNQHMEIMKGKDSPLAVRIWVDKGCGSTYKIGEQMVVNVQCNKDCYLRLFHTSAEGETKMIFPNFVDLNNRLEKEKVYSIGGESYGFQFDITEPVGLEMITAVASETQFEDQDIINKQISSGFLNFGRIDAKDYGIVTTRGIKVSAKNKSSIAQHKCMIRITR